MRLQRRILFVALLLMLCPAAAYANSGSALMIARFLHFTIFNLVISVFEGLLLTVIFRARIYLSLPLMFVANYFSAWIGYKTGNYLAAMASFNIYTIHLYYPRILTCFFLITLVTEWPFIFLSLYRKKYWLAKSLAALLLLNALTYVPLYRMYSRASNDILLKEYKVVPPSEISLPENLAIFFRKEGGQWMRYDEESHSPVSVDYTGDTVAGLKPFADAEKIDIINYMISPDKSRKVIQEPMEFDMALWSARILSENFESDWKFRAEYWAGAGIHAVNEKKKEDMWLAVAFPFLEWKARYPFHLPGDVLLFQWGDNQICLFDPEEKKVALLAHGSRPWPGTHVKTPATPPAPDAAQSATPT